MLNFDGSTLIFPNDNFSVSKQKIKDSFYTKVDLLTMDKEECLVHIWDE